MKTVEKQGRTVDEALELALKELNAKKDEVEVEVLEEGSRGLFGLLSRMARVRVTLKEKPEEKALEFLKGLMKILKLDPVMNLVHEEDGMCRIEIKGNNMGILIGKHGTTLNALQYLTGLVANKNDTGYKRIILDVEGYREKREKTLKELALKIARRVKETKKSIALEPMPPNERKIIHNALQGDDWVKTHSEGEEPYRRVIISPKYPPVR
ncbi:RNA-binding cell elongation regulator Jag/EloR [Thermosediminibacter oceani]|uniref:RNA-binding protein KhpB n=1 Tax=Thermosediminibacter oceani (strain ATCC BAA-1034 / DSM 16646 / JW/IW-1228P) TaxID=555079 RepID=D9S1B1_THEOJ|nr:RNA-binding cell elongation regulator Jag/EloR [Thermosediminibacter oceani]ADL08990.1 single-stranded nucleic acid binding R3H domain protein [Thermosediminibacter oceani DSM 16646]